MFNQSDQQLSLAQSAETAVPPPMKPPVADSIYVMPEKFHPRKQSSGAGRTLIIVLIILIVVAIVTGSYFAYDYLQKKQASSIVKVENSSPVVVPVQDNNILVVPTSTEATTTEATSTASTTEATTTDNSISSSTSPTVPSSTVVSMTPAPWSVDTDNDNLTDLEENLIGTSPVNPDTDNDEFKDGDEIDSGYSPLIAGGAVKAKLENAPFVKLLATDFATDNFSTLIPKKWQASTFKSTEQAIITADTGEVIKISVKGNTDRISALDWYMKNNPGVPAISLRQMDYGNISGIMSPDGLSVYMTDSLKSKLYVFEYIMDNGLQMRYPNMLKMMIKNMKLISGPVISSSTLSSTSSGASSSSSTVPVSTTSPSIDI